MVITEFKSCEYCHSGWLYKEESKGVFSSTKCECLRSYQDELRLKILLDRASISQDIIGYSLPDSYVGEDKPGNLVKITTYLEDFPKYSTKHLYFYGPYGTQKSTLLRYIGASLLAKGYSVHYTLTQNLIRTLMDSYYNNEGDAAKLEQKMLNVDVLLIDEMSDDKISKYKSGWQTSHLLPFLKNRLEVAKKSTIFASNSPPDNIGDYFKGALQDLIYREIYDTSMVFTDNYISERNISAEMPDLWSL